MPLSSGEKLTIAQMIIAEVAPEMDSAPQAEAGFEYLKRFLPQIERITVTEQDLAAVVLTGMYPVLRRKCGASRRRSRSGERVAADTRSED